ncbi:MAG: DUF2238 domain-containing protein [Burkholderiales bacterium]
MAPHNRSRHRVFTSATELEGAIQVYIALRPYVPGKKILAFIVESIVLAINATHELIEWAIAVALGQGADAFLGTQGDPWDTQSDMFLALIGGYCIADIFYDLFRQIERVQQSENST